MFRTHASRQEPRLASHLGHGFASGSNITPPLARPAHIGQSLPQNSLDLSALPASNSSLWENAAEVEGSTRDGPRPSVPLDDQPGTYPDPTAPREPVSEPTSSQEPPPSPPEPTATPNAGTSLNTHHQLADAFITTSAITLVGLAAEKCNNVIEGSSLPRNVRDKLKAGVCGMAAGSTFALAVSAAKPISGEQ
ncbi:hypothetical protein HDU93_009050, partial [Gonapodya sp. JEL0774]